LRTALTNKRHLWKPASAGNFLRSLKIAHKNEFLERAKSLPRRCALILLTGLALISAKALPASQREGDKATAPANQLEIFASILPQVEFIEAVGGERVHAQALLQPGQNPHAYEPSPKQLIALSKASAFFRVGVPFEDALVPRLQSTMKDLKIVDTHRGVRLRRMSTEEGYREHKHHELGNDANDPHIWLSPLLIIQQAINIRDALIQLDPENEKLYQTRCQAFRERLEKLHEELKNTLAPFAGREILVYHPSFGYFADAYGLRQVAVETGGKEPTPKALASFISLAKERKISIVFVQPQFSQASARAIAGQIGGTTIELNPLDKNCLENLANLGEKIAGTLLNEPAE